MINYLTDAKLESFRDYAFSNLLDASNHPQPYLWHYWSRALIYWSRKMEKEYRVMFRSFKGSTICVLLDRPSNNQPSHCAYIRLVGKFKGVTELEYFGCNIDYLLENSIPIHHYTSSDIYKEIVRELGIKMVVYDTYQQDSKLVRYNILVERDKESKRINSQ